jgi:hypothetical protein
MSTVITTDPGRRSAILNISTVTQEAAFDALAAFPYRDKLERIKRLRATFPGMGLTPAIEFFDAFVAAGSPMKVDFIADSPNRKSPTFPGLAGFEFPDHLARNYHQKEMKAAAGHLASELAAIDLTADAPDLMCAAPAFGLRAEMVKLLRDWSAAL